MPLPLITLGMTAECFWLAANERSRTEPRLALVPRRRLETSPLKGIRLYPVVQTDRIGSPVARW